VHIVTGAFTPAIPGAAGPELVVLHVITIWATDTTPGRVTDRGVFGG
jgi:hypothetical protein